MYLGVLCVGFWTIFFFLLSVSAPLKKKKKNQGSHRESNPWLAACVYLVLLRTMCLTHACTMGNGSRSACVCVSIYIA